MNKIVLVFGTRPELIKLAPIIEQFKKSGRRDQLCIVHTHQHEELLLQDLIDFDIHPDHHLKISRSCSKLSVLNAAIMDGLHAFIQNCSFNISAMVAQGDTCTTYCAGIFAHYNQIPFVHVEAGLRTGDMANPFPEEFYRKSLTMITDLHFAPTSNAKQNLMNEGVFEGNILVTGNTIIDHLRSNNLARNRMAMFGNELFRNTVLITTHRRESREKVSQQFLDSICHLAVQYPHKDFIWLGHPGTSINKVPLVIPKNLQFSKAISYSHMLKLYEQTALILTDSGGIQEEATYLGIPMIILRSKTERTEALKQGRTAFYTTDIEELSQRFSLLLNEPITPGNTAFGNGSASYQILEAITKRYLTVPQYLRSI
jgi:UDP-N-acetylglucosamine 2-epimerase (non-hydrolysing)